MAKCGNCKQEGKTVEHVRYCYGLPAKSVAKSNNQDNNTDSRSRVSLKKPHDLEMEKFITCNSCGRTVGVDGRCNCT